MCSVDTLVRDVAFALVVLGREAVVFGGVLCGLLLEDVCSDRRDVRCDGRDVVVMLTVVARALLRGSKFRLQLGDLLALIWRRAVGNLVARRLRCL